MTRPSKSKAIERLQKSLNDIKLLRDLSYESSDFKKWHRRTITAIKNTFIKQPEYTREFEEIIFYAHMIDAEYEIWDPGYESGLDMANVLLESMIDEIKEYWQDESRSSQIPYPQVNEQSSTNRIFLVHGREEGTKQAVARFVEKLGLEPVILDEQADKGRTIIAKFEEEARDVGYAVVILAPDDEGRLRNSDVELSGRPRQNVIFELGFFAGAFGRKHVCAVVKGDLEIPSDYDGVVYIFFDDSDGWKMKLFRELKSAGFDLDANRVF